MIALDINIGNRRSIFAPTIIQAKMPMPVAVERYQSVQRKPDLFLPFVPIETRQRGEVWPNTSNRIVDPLGQGVPDVATVLRPQQVQVISWKLVANFCFSFGDGNLG